MKYRTIVADPPWVYSERFASYSGDRRSGRPLPYESMGIDEIADLPIRDLADSSGCWLWLWTTNRYLPSAHRLVDWWGFRYMATVVWHKTGGCSPFSASYVSSMTDAEFLIAATVGSPATGEKLPSLVIERHRAGEHSQKPELFLDLIEAFTEAPRIELFARRQRLGWDTWGDKALEHVSLGQGGVPAGRGAHQEKVGR